MLFVIAAHRYCFAEEGIFNYSVPSRNGNCMNTVQIRKGLLKVVTNKYFITSLIFVVWCMYFDQNDWLSIRDKQQELNTVKGNIAYLDTQINKMTAERTELQTDNKKLEQYAREHYRMKQDNEDVYVIDTTLK